MIQLGTSPGGLVVKISPSNAGGVGSIPGWGAKIPHASGLKKKKKKKNTSNIVTNSIKTLKIIHISNLQIQCNLYQATNGIFHRTRTNNFTIYMEIQKTSNSQSNLEKEEWNWRNQSA